MEKPDFKVAICAICMLVLTAACAPNMKTEMTNYVLDAPVVEKRFTAPLSLDISNIGFSHKKTGNEAVPGNVGHNMGDINQRYARAAFEALVAVADVNSSPRVGLRLATVDVVQVVGKGFADFEISEHVTASWEVIDNEHGTVIQTHEISGTAAGKTGWGSAIAENARDRMGRAYQDLLDKTVQTFSQSSQFKQFILVSEVYAEPDNALQIAKSRVAESSASDRTELVNALRFAAVSKGLPELYDFSRDAISRYSLDTIQDESALLHMAISSPGFADGTVNSIVANSQDLNGFNDDGMTPLDMALAYGRDSVAVELVSAGAEPIIRYGGNALVSAEISYRLAELLRSESVPNAEVIESAIAMYEQAIQEAEFAITANDASIFAARVMRVLGPVVQYSAAAAEARYEARQSAKTSPVGLGFGYAEFTLQSYDSKTPAEAIADLKTVIADCNARIKDLRTRSRKR